MKTTAIVETEEGLSIVASSQRTLPPVQRALLREGEIAVSGPGHAEAKALGFAERHGYAPTRVSQVEQFAATAVIYSWIL
jgi:hypothetical protein